MKFPQWTPGRSGFTPTMIMIHHWGADGQNHEKVADFLLTNGRTDIHWVCSSIGWTPIVNETDTAWHAGDWNANLRAIGIECRPECGREDFHAVARLIAEIRDRWGPLPLVAHKDFFNTACPGRWYPRLQELSDLADAYRTGTYTKEEEMNPEDRKILHDMSWLMRNSYGPAIARLDQARVEEKAWRDSMTATIEALATAKGVDPAAVMATVEAAVTQALAGLEVTLTAQPEGGAR